MELLIIFLLLLLNGFFALYEIALVSSNRLRITALAEDGSRAARRVLQQIHKPEQTLSTIQIGITLIGIVSGAFGGMALADDMEGLLRLVPGLAPYAARLSVAVTIAVITYFRLSSANWCPRPSRSANPNNTQCYSAAPSNC